MIGNVPQSWCRTIRLSGKRWWAAKYLLLKTNKEKKKQKFKPKCVKLALQHANYRRGKQQIARLEVTRWPSWGCPGSRPGSASGWGALRVKEWSGRKIMGISSQNGMRRGSKMKGANEIGSSSKDTWKNSTPPTVETENNRQVSVTDKATDCHLVANRGKAIRCW